MANQAALPTPPNSYPEFRKLWADPTLRDQFVAAYTSGASSFVPALLPELAVALSGEETLAMLGARFGAAVDLALDPTQTDPDQPPNTIPDAIRSPVAEQTNGDWLVSSNMVGINVRTIGSFWNIIKYALTLPAAQNAIHLLPIWEPGVVGSLYGMSSWQLNHEFFSAELAELCPWLDTTGRQLRAVVNLLHMMGRTVGMDVIPHTDRFSEMALCFPEHFEWLQRQGTQLLGHAANLHETVQDHILAFVQRHGPALAGDPIPKTRDDLFDAEVTEAQRLRVLFGAASNLPSRLSRRNLLIHALTSNGYEPVPATMAPPFRGMAVDPRPEAEITDMYGQIWREYQITKPTGMSRVFGPLARYKLYEIASNGDGWALDFAQPRIATWRYVCDHYAQVQQQYNLDFMRGDMAHVQMRPGGVPDEPTPFYDILGAVKATIHEQGAPYFAYFAESFLAPRDVFGFGEEIDHLEAAHAEAALGDLQSTVVGSNEFLQRFRYYDDLRTTRRCTPAFTTMTADKDDPRFDLFYRTGNEARMLLALFLGNTPSYTGLGFETRNVHFEPAPNEHYTKLYVFQESDGPKATSGPYTWGQNIRLFNALTRLASLSDTLWPRIQGQPTRWLIAPDATGASPLMAWTQAEPICVCVLNTSPLHTIERILIPDADGIHALHCCFSTHQQIADTEPLVWNGLHFVVPQLLPGEGRVYLFEPV